MRIKILFKKPVIFSTKISVRIGDINYGGHVGNDRILSIIHEARILFLKQWNYSELDSAGVGLIMADSAIQYKAESFHGDVLDVNLSVDNLTPISFDIFYKLSTFRANKIIDIAYAKTGMVAFDYSSRSIANIPDDFQKKLV